MVIMYYVPVSTSSPIQIMTIPDECTGTKSSISYVSGSGLNGRFCECRSDLGLVVRDFSCLYIYSDAAPFWYSSICMRF